MAAMPGWRSRPSTCASRWNMRTACSSANAPRMILSANGRRAAGSGGGSVRMGCERGVEFLNRPRNGSRTAAGKGGQFVDGRVLARFGGLHAGSWRKKYTTIRLEAWGDVQPIEQFMQPTAHSGPRSAKGIIAAVGM